MADAFKDITVVSRGGLYETEDDLSLATSYPGAAIRMLNFEISQYGGYRRINGHKLYDASYSAPAGQGRILGIWIHNNTVYSARRNTGDATGSLGANPFAVVDESTIVTVTHSSHGLAVGSWVTFASATAVGGLTMNSTEWVVATVPSVNTYTFVHTSAATSTVSAGGGSSATYSYSYLYSLYKYVSGVGWGSDITSGTRNAIGVTKLRHTGHTFTGSDAIVAVDGVNRPFRHINTDYIELFDRQGTSDTDTEAQLSNVFSSTNGDATVTVSQQLHGLVVGDTVKFSGVNVNIGGVSINSVAYSVATVADDNTFTFELSGVSSASSQASVGGTAINFFYIHAAAGKNIDAAKYTTTFSSHQFFAGMPAAPNLVVFSAPNTDLKYAAADGAGSINVGFPISAIRKFRDYLYVFGKTRIRRIEGTSGANFILRDVADDVGCIAADSIVEIGGDVLFLASDGIRPLQGTARIGDVELETISKPVQQLLLTLPTNHDLDMMSSVVIRNKTQFRYYFPSESTLAADTAGVIGGLRFADRRMGWEFGQLLGVRPFVSDSGLINNVETIVHGELDGTVHQQDSGDSFNTADVIALYATPFLFMSSTEMRKAFHHLSLFTRPEGVSTINMAVAYNWDDPSVPIPTTYALTTAGALLRYTVTGGTYDSTFTFDGNSSPVLETDIEGSGRAISFVFTSVGTQSPYSISGFSLTYKDLGYR